MRERIALQAKIRQIRAHDQIFGLFEYSCNMIDRAATALIKGLCWLFSVDPP